MGGPGEARAGRRVSGARIEVGSAGEPGWGKLVGELGVHAAVDGESLSGGDRCMERVQPS